MPDIKYVTVTEDYYETDNETGKPRLIHAAGARIQERAARAYGDAIKVKEGAGADDNELVSARLDAVKTEQARRAKG